MSAALLAAIAPPKTPRRIGESVAWASQAFELDAAADHRQPSLRETGWRARGALAIDVPRILAATDARLALRGHGSGGRDLPHGSRPASAGILAATPRGSLFATTVVERGTGSGFALCPAPTGKDA